MRKGETLATLVAVCLALAIGLGLSTGLWSTTAVLTELLYVLVVSVVGVLVWGFRDRFMPAFSERRRAEDRPSVEAQSKPAAPPAASPRPTSKVRVERLMSFNLGVSSGRYEERHFVLSRGDEVEGTLVEVDGQDFDWYVLDDAGYASFVDGSRPRRIQSGLARPAGHVHFAAPKTGGYHLVLDCSRLRYRRTVEVRLTKRSSEAAE